MESENQKKIITQLRPPQLYKLKHLRQLQQFSNNLQKGDLGLGQIIDYAFVEYGQTKTGKTATGHILSGNPLKGERIDGQQMVQSTTSRNNKAKIGNQGNSQTMIPNFFEVKLHNNKYLNYKTFVIDTPGYGDTYGVLRILANGYYHYRLYSKVKNMKFLLCFDRSHISNTAAGFIDTIKQFTESFKDYLNVKQDIWKSCAFLITKVQETENTQNDLEDKLLNLADKLKTLFTEQNDRAFRQFVRYIVKQKRVFYIKKIRRGESAQMNGLLERIDEKISEWWSRSVEIGKQQVDMSKISFSLSEQVRYSIKKQERSKQQFIELIQYYNIRIKQFVQIQGTRKGGNNRPKGSLGYVVNELVKDAMGKPESHNFLSIMKNYINEYYNDYDPEYNDQREIRQKQLFSIQNEVKQGNNYSQKNKRQGDKNYIVKKFNALKNIQKYKNTNDNVQFGARSLQELQKIQRILFSIVKQFNKVSYKRNKSAQIIYKYGYVIHRTIQQARVFTLLMIIFAQPQVKSDLLQSVNNKFIDIFTPVLSFLGIGFSFQGKNNQSYEFLRNQYIKKYDQTHQNFKSVHINQSLVDFFYQDISQDQGSIKKIIKLVLKYSDQILNPKQQDFEIDNSQRSRLIHKLTVSRLNCQNLYLLTFEKEIQRQQNIILIRKITKNLGKILQLSKKYESARKVYKTIRFVDSVCRIYKVQLKIKPEDINLRIEYGKYLGEHFREGEAIEILQEAFQIAQSVEDLNLIKQLLTELRIQMKSQNNVNTYQDQLFQQNYFEEFSNQLREQIDPKPQ